MLWPAVAVLALLLLSCTVSRRHSGTSLRPFRITGHAQGTTYGITYFAEQASVQQEQIDSIFSALDASLSIYKPGSLINRFNDSDEGVVTDAHFERVIRKSLDVFRQTGGAFDVTVYPLVRIWGFGTKEINDLPDSTAIRSALACVGSGKLTLRDGRLDKKLPCVKIDVNGIAQGYSVDVVAGFLESRGIVNYIVEVGGEIRVRGKKYPENEAMTIGIETPSANEFEHAGIREIIRIEEGAVTTSGSYRKFREAGGKRLSHIIDPATGYPSQSEIISATVIAPDAITADGFDNALLAAGLTRAFTILRNTPRVEAYLIYKKPDGSVADTMSAGFRPYLVR